MIREGINFRAKNYNKNPCSYKIVTVHVAVPAHLGINHLGFMTPVVTVVRSNYSGQIGAAIGLQSQRITSPIIGRQEHVWGQVSIPALGYKPQPMSCNYHGFMNDAVPGSCQRTLEQSVPIHKDGPTTRT